MTSPLTQAQLTLYGKALRGEMGLIGWGFRDNYHFHRWQENYPIQFFVDTNYNYWDQTKEGCKILNPLALRDYDPKHYAVINYYNIPWVEKYTRRVGKMACLPAVPLQSLAHAICHQKKKQKPNPFEPLTAQQAKQIISVVAPHIFPHKTPAAHKGKKNPLLNTETFQLLGSYHWAQLLGAILRDQPVKDPQNGHVALVCNALYPGGAERQIINCSIGFKEKGWEPHFLAVMKNEYAPHYLEIMRQKNIPVSYAMDGLSAQDSGRYLQEILSELPPSVRVALWHMPIDFMVQIASTIRHFRRTKPQVIVAYLDWANVIAAIAGVLCGVPEIIISGRNYGPAHFPHFYGRNINELFIFYQLLAQCPNVRLTNNAPAAGEDYAQWLKLPTDYVHFVPNCLTESFMTKPVKASLDLLRAQFSITPKDKVVLGIFRLSPEKRPEKFLEVVAKLVKADRTVRAIICGIGVLQPDLEKLARKLGIDKHVRFAGMITEVREMMNVAHILLHTASHEGMPNVMLEAQSQGLPVVCTKSGGVDECLAPAMKPYGFALNDWDGVTKAALRLLKNPALRKSVSEAARRHVLREHSIAKLVDRYLALTRYADSAPSPEQRRKG